MQVTWAWYKSLPINAPPWPRTTPMALTTTGDCVKFGIRVHCTRWLWHGGWDNFGCYCYAYDDKHDDGSGGGSGGSTASGCASLVAQSLCSCMCECTLHSKTWSDKAPPNLLYANWPANQSPGCSSMPLLFQPPWPRAVPWLFQPPMQLWHDDWGNFGITKQGQRWIMMARG